MDVSDVSEVLMAVYDEVRALEHLEGSSEYSEEVKKIIRKWVHERDDMVRSGRIKSNRRESSGTTGGA